jgi:hypothetical protein
MGATTSFEYTDPYCDLVLEPALEITRSVHFQNRLLNAPGFALPRAKAYSLRVGQILENVTCQLSQEVIGYNIVKEKTESGRFIYA